MRTATHHTKKTLHPHKLARKIKTRQTSILKPIKNANKKVIYYVTRKPAQAVGITALVAAFIVGAVYAKMKFFNHG